MNELGLVAIGVVLMLDGMWALRCIDLEETRRRRLLAETILRRHGMATEIYVASVGVSDPELACDLDEFASSGYIVIDGKGGVVGDLCLRTKRGHHLRIVSDFR